MELDHSFAVPVGLDEAWQLLLDVERLAPCMPGAAVESVTGDDILGSVKVKVGPINLTYKGTARFVEKDEAGRRLVMDGQGRDARGNGTARAHVIATLHPDGGQTRIEVHTDLAITGKPAQFGRGVIVDVSNRLLGQFVQNLEAELSAPPAATETEPEHAASTNTESADGASPQAAPPRPAPRPPVRQEHVEPIDLLAHAGPAVAKRAAPLVAAAMLVALIVLLRRQRR